MGPEDDIEVVNISMQLSYVVLDYSLANNEGRCWQFGDWRSNEGLMMLQRVVHLKSSTVMPSQLTGDESEGRCLRWLKVATLESILVALHVRTIQ